MRFMIILALLLLFPAVGSAQTPVIDVKCNGLESNVLVSPLSGARLTFEIVAGSGGGNTVDIWIILKTIKGYLSYDGNGPYRGWNRGLGHAYYTGRLQGRRTLALDVIFPEGNYACYLGLDAWADGVFDLKCLYTLDQVDFTVGEPAPMVLIPAGEFLMGDHHDSVKDAKPVHPVYIDDMFMDVFETTVADYCNFLNSARTRGMIVVRKGVVHKVRDSESYCATYPTYIHSRFRWDGSIFRIVPGKENHPATQMSWYGAVAYANWRSELEGLTPCYDLDTWECTSADEGGYRLPTEAEWEKAARGGECTPYFRYPWGDQVAGSQANFWMSGDPFEGGRPQTAPVGYYDGNQVPAGVDMANGYGLYDMGGNVWEWCDDWYDPNYFGWSPYRNPTGPSYGTKKVIRGGAWDTYAELMRCAVRGRLGPPGNRRY